MPQVDILPPVARWRHQVPGAGARRRAVAAAARSPPPAALLLAVLLAGRFGFWYPLQALRRLDPAS